MDYREMTIFHDTVILPYYGHMTVVTEIQCFITQNIFYGDMTIHYGRNQFYNTGPWSSIVVAFLSN